MKRWPLRILLRLVLGAISTVAVAWAAAAFSRWPEPDPTNWTERPGEWPCPTPLHWPTNVNEIRARGATWSIARFDADQGETDSNWAYFLIDETSFGWPFLGMKGQQWTEYVIDQTSVAVWYRTDGHPAPTVWRRGIPIKRGFGALPLRPIWPGFVIDTLFYAAIWGGAWFGVVGGKRFIRSKRGRCPRCGYDLRGNRGGGCSECGWNREESTA